MDRKAPVDCPILYSVAEDRFQTFHNFHAYKKVTRDPQKCVLGMHMLGYFVFDEGLLNPGETELNFHSAANEFKIKH